MPYRSRWQRAEEKRDFRKAVLYLVIGILIIGLLLMGRVKKHLFWGAVFSGIIFSLSFVLLKLSFNTIGLYIFGFLSYEIIKKQEIKIEMDK